MNFGIIGYGNLGKAVASALIGTGDVKARDIHICDKSIDALSIAEKERFNVYTIDSLNSLINASDVICLVVKGYVFEELAKQIDPKSLKNKLIISFMAGETIEKISSLFIDAQFVGDPTDVRTGENVVFSKPVIARAMPSLAIAENEGIIAYTKLPAEVAAIFDKFGYAFETEPEAIEKVTAFASCGLGFAAYLIDAFKTAGEALGFPADTAGRIAAQTFKNACDRGDFADTVKAVAVPGGATEQGINHMNNSDVFAIVAEAMQKAYMKVASK